MNSTKILIVILLIICNIKITKISAQPGQKVKLNFQFENETINFSNNLELILIYNNKEIVPLKFVNAFIVPDFEGVEFVDVLFIYKNQKLLFNKMKAINFRDVEWKLGMKKEPFYTFKKPTYFLVYPIIGGMEIKRTIQFN